MLVNCSPSGEFKLERGLCQGDPLSPFLYLLVAKVLSLMVSKAAKIGSFKAAEVWLDKVRISHLQYADDTIFIGSVCSQNAWVMKRILKNFELISRLKINYNKCCLMGLNVGENRIQEMADILGCVIGEIPFSYLGIRVGASYKKPSKWASLVRNFKI